MAVTSGDILGNAPPRKEEGARQVNPETIIKREFEFPESVAHFHCTHCGLTYEIDDVFKRMLEKKIGLDAENDRQYFQTEKCQGCLGESNAENITLEEVAIH